MIWNRADSEIPALNVPIAPRAKGHPTHPRRDDDPVRVPLDVFHGARNKFNRLSN